MENISEVPEGPRPARRQNVKGDFEMTIRTRAEAEALVAAAVAKDRTTAELYAACSEEAREAITVLMLMDGKERGRWLRILADPARREIADRMWLEAETR